MEQKAIVIKELNKTYANGKVALKNISFDVKEGDFFALLGPNGAGKSTTIGILSSLVNKTSGKINIFGYNLEKNPSQAKSMIGLVPQEFNFDIFEKAIEILITQAGYYGVTPKVARHRAEILLKALNLWDERNLRARFLSGGMKRRLLIARALIHAPKLLILDEPTAGVDIELRRTMWEFLTNLNQAGTTIVLTTHYLEEAEQLCKNIGIIHEGRLIEYSSMKNLLQKLHVETFVLYLVNPINDIQHLENNSIKLIDESTIEINLDEKQTLTDMIKDLSNKGIQIKTMRNKVNRLEELFLRLTSNHYVDDVR